MAFFSKIKQALGFDDAGEDLDELVLGHEALPYPNRSSGEPPAHVEEKVIPLHEYEQQRGKAASTAGKLNLPSEADLSHLPDDIRKPLLQLLSGIKQREATPASAPVDDDVVEKLREQLKASEAQRRATQIRVNEMNERMADLQLKAERADIERKGLLTKLKVLQVKSGIDADSLDTAHLDNMSEQIDTLNAQLAQEKERAAQLQQQLDEAQRQAAQSHSQQEWDEQHDKWRKQLDAISARLEEVGKENAQMREQLDAANEQQSSAADLQRQLDEATAGRQQKDDEIAELKAKVDALESQVQQVEQQAYQDNQDSQQQNQRLSKIIEELNQKAKDTAERQNRRDIDLANRIDDYKQRLAATRTLADDFEQQVEELKQKLKQAQQRLDKASQNDEQHQVAITLANEQNEHLQASLETACAERDRLQARLDNIEAEQRDRATRAEQELQRQVEELNAQLGEQRDALEATKKALGQREAEMSRIVDEQDQISRERDSLVKQLAQLERDQQIANAAAEARNTEKSTAARRIAILQNRIDELTRENADLALRAEQAEIDAQSDFVVMTPKAHPAPSPAIDMAFDAPALDAPVDVSPALDTALDTPALDTAALDSPALDSPNDLSADETITFDPLPEPEVANPVAVEAKPKRKAAEKPKRKPAEAKPKRKVVEEKPKPAGALDNALTAIDDFEDALPEPKLESTPVPTAPAIDDIDDIDWLMPAEPDAPAPEPEPEPEPTPAPRVVDPRQLSLF